MDVRPHSIPGRGRTFSYLALQKREGDYLRAAFEEALVQTLTETFWQLEDFFAANELNHVAHAVVNRETVPAALQVLIDPRALFGGEIPFHVVNKLSADFATVDFKRYVMCS